MFYLVVNAWSMLIIMITCPYIRPKYHNDEEVHEVLEFFAKQYPICSTQFEPAHTALKGWDEEIMRLVTTPNWYISFLFLFSKDFK